MKPALTSLFYRLFFNFSYGFIYLALLTNFALWTSQNSQSEELTPLSLKEAVQLALAKNPDVLKAHESVNQADSARSATFSKFLPTLSADAKYNYQKDAVDQNFANFAGETYNQYQVGFNLTQPIYNGGAMFAGLSYSKKQQEIKNLELQIAERNLSESVLENFYTLLLNERFLQILKDTEAVSISTLKKAESYVHLGRVQKVDLLQLKTQNALLKPKISAAENQIQTSAANLATQLHILNLSALHVRGKLVSPNSIWVKSMLEQKSGSLPEVARSRTLVDQFSDQRTVTMAPYWPQLNLVGQWGRLSYAKTDLLDSNATHWTIGLELSIPIFSGLSSIYERESLLSQEKQMEFDETKTADIVSVNQIQTEKNLLLAETQLDSAKEAAQFGNESLKEAEREFKLSSINYLQYQSSQQAYLDSENGYNQAKYDYIVAIAKYFNAMGIPISKLVDELEELSKKPD